MQTKRGAVRPGALLPAGTPEAPEGAGGSPRRGRVDPCRADRRSAAGRGAGAGEEQAEPNQRDHAQRRAAATTRPQGAASPPQEGGAQQGRRKRAGPLMADAGQPGKARTERPATSQQQEPGGHRAGCRPAPPPPFPPPLGCIYGGWGERGGSPEGGERGAGGRRAFSRAAQRHTTRPQGARQRR